MLVGVLFKGLVQEAGIAEFMVEGCVRVPSVSLDASLGIVRDLISIIPECLQFHGFLLFVTDWDLLFFIT